MIFVWILYILTIGVNTVVVRNVIDNKIVAGVLDKVTKDKNKL